MSGSIFDRYTDLWKAIVRPPRDVYELKDLGPAVFKLENRTYQRTDLCLKNSRMQNLMCSHFEPIPSERVAEQLPCVIYLHGNCSSRLEAICALNVILPSNITIFCFDFAGSGLSDGEYLSLGYYEREDVAAVVTYLRDSKRTSLVGLWGRSMGAATALLHADRDPSIAGVVLDSPFSDLKVLVEEVVDTHINFKLPRWLIGLALQAVRSSIKQNVNFDVYDIAPIKHVSNSFIPALFAAGTKDKFIRPHHTQELHDAYAGDKNMVMIEGDHNSARTKFFMDSVAIFFYNTLQCESLPKLSASPRRQPGSHRAGGRGSAAPAARLRSRQEEEDAAATAGQGQTMAASDGGPAPPQHGAAFVQEAGEARESGAGPGIAPPSSSADEEEMLNRAIMLSLNESAPAPGPT